MPAILEIKTSAEEAEWHGLQTAGYQVLVTTGIRTGSRCFYDMLSHTYHLDGSPVVSVTQAIVGAGRVDTTWFTEESRRRGTAVHEATVAVDRDAAHAIEIPEEWNGFVEAYDAFVFDMRPTYKYTEAAFWLPSGSRHGDSYGGRPDRVVRGFKGDAVEGRFVLYLGANGRYKLRRKKRAEDYVEFMADLRMVRESIGYGAGV